MLGVVKYMSIMSGMGNSVSKRPGITIVIILVLTIIFSIFGSAFENNADPESFNPDHELIMAAEEAGDTFGTQSYSLLMVVKAEDDNLLEIDDLKTMIECEDTLRNDETVAAAIVPSQSNPTGVASLANLVVMEYGLIQGRGAVDFMLHNIINLPPLLNDTLISDDDKGRYLIENISLIDQVLSTILNNNNGELPQFNKTNSLSSLDGLSFQYGPDPVPTFLGVLQAYDPQDAFLQTNTLLSSVNEPLNMLNNYTVILPDSDYGNTTIMNLTENLTGLPLTIQNLDGTIVGLNFGI
jgi:hypothetical protein